MVFASPIFLLIFLPIVILGYLLTPRSLKNLFLLISSIVFYSWGAPKFIFAILLTTSIDFILAKKINNSSNDKKRKYWLLTSIVINIGFLFYFKYFNFFIDNANYLLRSLNVGEISLLSIIMPIGISFYTFESITYLVDVYRKVHKPLDNFWDYQLYILFFPKLIAGPITRYHEIADQITDRFNRSDLSNLISGFIRFCLGLSKKVLIANSLGAYADAVYDTPLTDLDSTIVLLGSLTYSFQIYFDFSGYSDMALGLAKMFDFSLPENFNNPYVSGSVTEFWRRWHITLGSWMKNYLYIPLGGNRVTNLSRVYFNLLIVFIISGFWHGASWNFIVWGLAHGLFMVIERLFLLKYLNKIPKIISIIYTFTVVNLIWILFRSYTFEQSVIFYKTILSFNFSKIDISLSLAFYLGLASLFSFITFLKIGRTIENVFYNPNLKPMNTILLLAISMILFTFCMGSIYSTGFNPFIYFRF